MMRSFDGLAALAKLLSCDIDNHAYLQLQSIKTSQIVIFYQTLPWNFCRFVHESYVFEWGILLHLAVRGQVSLRVVWPLEMTVFSAEVGAASWLPLVVYLPSTQVVHGGGPLHPVNQTRRRTVDPCRPPCSPDDVQSPHAPRSGPAPPSWGYSLWQ